MRKIFVMFDAILFDNDGVLVDTERLYFQACQEILKEMFGIELTLHTYQEYGYTKGIGTTGWLQEKNFSDGVISQYQKSRDRRYEYFLSRSVTPMSYVEELLKFLRQESVSTAIVTATFRAHLDLAHSQTGLLDFFSFAITHDDVERGKPFPDGYLLAAKRLTVAPGNCLVLEDSPRGVVAGKSAGMTVWAIPSDQTKELDFTEADEVFDSLEEVLFKLQSSN
jgi:HAD superfamily hydrolase (TIGR01509 family)